MFLELTTAWAFVATMVAGYSLACHLDARNKKEGAKTLEVRG